MSGLVASLGLSTALISGMIEDISQFDENIEEQHSHVAASTQLLLNSGKDASLGDAESISGIDIASHQHQERLNHEKVVDSSQKFAFIKATEGNHYINPHFRDDVISFIKEDIPVGFYHYAQPSNDVQSARIQAELFIKVTGIDQGVRALPPVLDIEKSNNVSPSELVAWTHEFVATVEKLTGLDTMIYTYPSFWENEMGNTKEFNHLPLWIADYNKKESPGKLPGGWERWDFWQYTEEGRVGGIEGNVDKNIFNGSEEALEALYASTLDFNEEIYHAPKAPSLSSPIK